MDWVVEISRGRDRKERYGGRAREEAEQDVWGRPTPYLKFLEPPRHIFRWASK